MNVLINFTILTLVIIEYFSFFYTILRMELKIDSRKQVLLSVIFFAFMAGFSFVDLRRTSLYFIGILFSVGIAYLIFEISPINIFKLFIMAFPALSILEAIIICVLEIITDMSEKENAVTCIICMIAVLWLYYVLLGNKLDKDAFYLSNRVWFIVSMVTLLILAFISYYSYILIQLADTRKKMVGTILNTAGGAAIFILIYVMIYYFNTKQKYQTQMDILEQYNEQQEQYFKNLLKKEQDTRQFRHDITSHLLQIQNYCVNGEHKEGEQYIKELLNNIILINKKEYSVGNDIIDTILNTYLSPIALNCTIKVKGCVDHEITVSKIDLCVIVSNLIKNAVEAVEQCSSKEKEIYFEVNQGKQFLSIKTKNTVEKENLTVQNKYPITEKEDKRMHGLEIKNIEAVLETYQGNYQYRIEDNYYIAEVQLQI